MNICKALKKAHSIRDDLITDWVKGNLLCGACVCESQEGQSKAFLVSLALSRPGQNEVLTAVLLMVQLWGKAAALESDRPRFKTSLWHLVTLRPWIISRLKIGNSDT